MGQPNGLPITRATEGRDSDHGGVGFIGVLGPFSWTFKTQFIAVWIRNINLLHTIKCNLRRVQTQAALGEFGVDGTSVVTDEKEADATTATLRWSILFGGLLEHECRAITLESTPCQLPVGFPLPMNFETQMSR